MIIGAALSIGGLIWLRSRVNRPVEHESASRIITIPPGTGTKAIIARLADAGVVRHPNSLILYLFLTGRSSRLQAGDYVFPSPISEIEAVQMIRRGDVHYERVTIREGANRFQIADMLATKTGKATTAEFHQLMNDPSLLSRIAPEARNLEGYLFPDTYNYSSLTAPEELVRAMVRRFDEVFGPESVSRASQLGMTVHQVVTLASIIEEEARVDQDRPLIGSVLMNRLRRGMPLAADPTFIYAAILADDYDGNPNQPRHRRRNSPYNTYIYTGLPPGPIASPGRESLEAALRPAQTDYLYFVVGYADGRHRFSRTAAEHDIAVAEYRRLRQSLQSGNSH
ncbi:MAG TPA: endolytic transglycosylase MltG [Blastocatellia bacterium]|nr:endolytic transglycosylase MltG [Blastocatellia bacterium]